MVMTSVLANFEKSPPTRFPLSVSKIMFDQQSKFSLLTSFSLLICVRSVSLTSSLMPFSLMDMLNDMTYIETLDVLWMLVSTVNSKCLTE